MEEEEVVVEGVEEEVEALHHPQGHHLQGHHPQGLPGGLHQLDQEDLAVLRQEELEVIRHLDDLEADSFQLQAPEAADGQCQYIPEVGQLH